MKKKIIMSGSIFLWMLCIIFVVSGRDIYAAEDRVVKVAFFPMDGYHIINEDGNYDGMDVAYLNALCEYTDWEIEYVPCDSWEEALQLLSNQKVDLVGSAQYSAERTQIYQYADLASGYTFGVIATNPESTIAYEDFTAMQQITFGMVENYVDGRSELDVVYEIMLKMGMELTWPLETHTIGGKNVYEIGMGALMICLDDHITTEVAEGMVALHKELSPETWRVVFKDNGFADDSAKVNIKEILKSAGLEEDAFTTV